MNTQVNHFAVAVLASVCAGCASMPNVEVGYYGVRGALDVLVTQTATCTVGDVPSFTDDVKFFPKYFADPNSRHTVDLSTLGNGWSKADATFEFFPDGRLKSINATQAGQAGEVLSAAIKTLSAVVKADVSAADTKAACGRLREIVGDGKTLTIVHRGSTDFAGPGVAFTQTGIGEADYRTLRPIFGRVSGSVAIAPPASSQHSGTPERKGQALRLVEPGIADVRVTIARGEEQAPTWRDSIAVPQAGIPYTLVIQRAPAFGKNEFELVLQESGRVAKLRYAGAADVADAVGVITEARTATADPTLADEVARIKAEADLIFQQQRLILCQTDPVNCPKP